MAQTTGPTSSANPTNTGATASSADAQALNQIAPGTAEQTPVAMAQINNTLSNSVASADAPAGVKGVDMGMIKDSLPNINPAALDASAAIQAREARAQANPNFTPSIQASAKSGAIGYTAMKFGQVENLNKPAAGQTATVHADAGEQLKVNFDPNSAELSVRNGDLIFSFNDGSRIVVDDFVMAGNQMPSLLLPDGTLLAGGVVVAQLSGKNVDDLFNIETAAGPNAGGANGSGGFIYSDDLGGVIDLLDKLPPIPFVEMAFPRPPEVLNAFVFPIDDAPGVQPNINDIVDETGGFNPNNPANTSNNVRTGTIIPNYGNDGAGSIALQPGFTADGSVAGGQLTSHGSPVTSTFDPATGTITGKDAEGHTIFTMQIKPDGTYEFKLLGQLDHADKTDPDDKIDLHFDYIVRDSDGDSAIGHITIGVKDDGPVATPDVGQGVVIVHEYNVIGGAPDFPALQEQKNLPQDRPDLFKQGTDKASNVFIDQPTTITIDRFQSPTQVAGAHSALFAFTQDAQGNITNIKLIFGDATANPDNNGPTSASYKMETGGKLGFFIATAVTDALKEAGVIDASGNPQPGFTFGLKQNPDGSYNVEYTHNGVTKSLGEARFGGDFMGQDVHGVAGRQDGDANNTLRYGFEDMPLEQADKDYNDVQFKVTVNPTYTNSSEPVKGNVLINDNSGEDHIPGPVQTNHAVVTQVKSEINGFKPLETGNDPVKGKFTTIQGEYGLLKIFENGEYEYQYNKSTTNGDLKDVFTYTMRDRDGDTSTTTLTINLGVKYDHTPNITPPGAEINEDLLLVPGTDSVTKTIIVESQDGVDSIKLTKDGLPALSANGQPVTYTVSPDGKTLTGSVGNDPVFTVKLNDPVKQPDGTYKVDYTFTLNKPLDNPGAGENITNIPVQVVVTDPDGDKATSTIPLKVIDDVPVAHDDAKAMGTTSVATGNIITNDNFGADGASPTGPKVTSISYGGVTKTFDTATSVVTFETPKGVLEIKADGSYTFTRNASLGELNETFNYTIKDADGDTSTAKLTLTGNDNPVTIVTPNPQDPYAGGNGAILDEDQLPVPGTDSVVKTISFTAPDGVQSVKLTADGLPSLTANDKPVTYTVSPDGKTLTGIAGGQTIFTVVLADPIKQADGSYKANYTFTLQQPLDNPGTGENVTNIPVKFVATDTDGDSATGTLPLQVVDDIPHAVDDSKAMGTSTVANGNIITNDTYGADGQGTGAPAVNSISYGGVTKTFDTPTSVVSFTTPSGVLEIKADGSYTFTRNASLGNLNETFNYTIKDADGDISQAKLTLTGNDNPVTIVTPNPQDPYAGGNGARLDEDQLPVPGVDSVVKSVTFTAPDGVASIKLTTDGLPALQANSQPVSYTLSADGKTVTGIAGGQTIFTVVLGAPVKQGDGSYKADYTFTLLKPLDNKGEGENITNIPVKFIATDTDGDSATGTLPLQVVDDVPVANDDTNIVTNGGSVDGNVITGYGQGQGFDVLSADGPNKITSVSFGDKTLTFGPDSKLDVGGAFILIQGQYGTLKIYENGQYTYKHNGSSETQVDQFKYVLTDKDGDSDPATLTITAPNQLPTIPDLQGDKIIDETTDINKDISGNISATNASAIVLGTAAGTGAFAADGSLMGGKLTSNGQDVHVALVNGKYVGYTGSDANAAGAKVFELTLNGTQYNFKQFSNIDHADKSDPNDIISLKFAVTAKDSDGDTDTGMLKIDIRDDAPVANPDTNVAKTVIHEYNVIGGAPDFPTLQEQKNLIADRPDLYAQGTAKASNVDIDLPTSVLVERLKSDSFAAGQHSALFGFTLTGDGVTNVQLLFGIASSNPDDNGPMSAQYNMTSGGKLGFFILQDATQLMKDIGATDNEGNLREGYSFNVVHKDDGSYKVTYTYNGETHELGPNVMFAGDMLGQPVHGVAGREENDPNNVLRYGFEDLPLNNSDTDYNDVQIKVTINPIITEVTDPIHGNVLPNDVVGQDDLPGWQYGTKVTQVAVGEGNFTSLTSNDGEGKYISVKGEYGTLKIYEDGHYTYTYAGEKKDGDLQDDFRYTITDFDGDTSSSTLKITINPATATTTMALMAATTADAAHAAAFASSVDTGFAPGEMDSNLPEHKRPTQLGGELHDPSEKHSDAVISYDEPVHFAKDAPHDVDGQVLNGSAVNYSLGHQGSESALHADLTSNGETIKTVVVDNTVHGFVGDTYDADNSRDVFKLELDQDGRYAFDLQGKIDQADAGTLLSFDYTAKDTDGSAIEGQVVIGVQGDHASAVTAAPANSLGLHDLLDSPAAAPHTDVAVNTLSNADIVNSILDDDHPQNGYAGS